MSGQYVWSPTNADGTRWRCVWVYSNGSTGGRDVGHVFPALNGYSFNANVGAAGRRPTIREAAEAVEFYDAQNERPGR